VAGWNVLATSLEARRDALFVALRRLGRFRPGGYRNVIVGVVEAPAAFLYAVREALAHDPLLPTALAKVVPIETTLRFDPADPVPALAAAVEPFLERRGLKGRLNTPSVEREVGDHVWRALEARGATPRVDFRDPDAVLVIETLGDQAGLAVLPRALRTAYPFVRIR
jgi:tRNA(Ser,Leu) C12 N-acetylase TAN1